ncbi:MAG: ATP-grasp domain-containing protein [Candidatus Shapirobacteria bacterium]
MNSNLENLLNQSPFDFYFLVVDELLDIDLPQLNNFQKIYLSDYPSVKIKNSGKLLSDPKVIDYISKKSKENNRTPAIISFKASSKIDFLCKKNSWVNINNPGSLNRFLEDKIKFSEICTQFNLPAIPSSIDSFTQENFLKYQQLYNNHLVVQTHFGWAGNSTFDSNNWPNIESKIAPNTLVKFSPFLEGFSLLNNCCLTKSGLIQSPPALQYTGLIELTDNPFATVGRQWPANISEDLQEKVKSITNNFGDILKRLNYKGFFGLDFFVSQDQVYLLECNPRLTASFAFYTQIELNQNLTPLFYFHLAEFLNLDYQIDIESEQNRFYNQNLIGSEIVKKDENNLTIKKFNDFSVFSKDTNPVKIDYEKIAPTFFSL